MTTTAERIVAVNAAAWDYWRWHATQSGEWVTGYLASRGLRGTVAGQAPAGWARLVPTLRRRGFTDTELLDAGLALEAKNGGVGDAFRDRLVLPIRDTSDRIIGFTARRNPATDDDPDAPPKYLNTTSTPAYDKSHVLYGLDADAAARIARGGIPVLVEGALDAEAVRRAGNDLVPLGLCGTAITAGHLQQLRDIDSAAVGRLISATDADTAGQGAVCRLWNLLTTEETATVRAAALEPGTDPADLVRAGRRTQLRGALVNDARPIIQAAIDVTLTGYDLEHVEGALAGLRHIAAAIRGASPAVLAQATGHLTKRLADTTDYDVVVAEIVDAAAVRGPA
ncbi:toprim domain-containing protein [Isoptericola sp. QY 916]|uniref:toprim domain-containing protein n=1 Tax=Isoptericola sp. QY 916 TaxID=2782570 RepID=UPI003D2FBCF6|nr:toprim domain-containing protein [Isoptericola sp. QY 916]